MGTTGGKVGATFSRGATAATGFLQRLRKDSQEANRAALDVQRCWTVPTLSPALGEPPKARGKWEEPVAAMLRAKVGHWRSGRDWALRGWAERD